MKKWLTLLLILMLIAVLALPAMADGDTQFTITPSTTEAKRGDEITFTVTVSGSNQYASFSLKPSFDASVYEMVGGQCTVEGAALKDFKPTNGFIATFSEATAYSGSVGTFTLKVKDDAALGQTQVQATASVDYGAVSAVVTAANVNITCEHEYDNACDTTCNKCGTERAAEHAWDKGAVTDPADCSTGKVGTKTYTCTVCGETKTEEIPADHTWDNGTVTKEPSCETEGELTHTCTTCGQAKTEPIPAGHKFDGDWQKDAEGHWLICACGAVSDKETHTYGEKWESDGTHHWHVCEECGYENKAEHTPGPEATEYTDQVCTTCDKILQWAWHTCTWGEEWFRDDRGHGHQCINCGKVSPVEKHDYEDDCDPDCSICGYTRLPQHVYSDQWTSDANGHWHACALCGEGLEIEPHVPGPEATATTPQLCLTCGFEIKPSTTHVHKFLGEWNKDAEGHWKECTCGLADEKHPHNWDEGVVTREPTSTVVGRKTFTCKDCGEKKTESIETTPSGTEPAPQQPVQKPGFPWWLIIVIVAVPVVAIGTVIIIGVIGGKKQEGKYSGK